MPAKTLDAKLQLLRDDPSANVFILADAKDADMAFGISAPGRSPEHHAAEAKFRSLDEYRNIIRENTEQGLVDIMLMSASTNEVLAIQQGLFRDSHVTPAIRANDTTDIWLAGSGRYSEEKSRPFRTAALDFAMCGKSACDPGEPVVGSNLGLYSVTFNNEVDADARSLEAYGEFRREAEAKGFRHFLEVFAPNAPTKPIPDVGRYLNDMIVRTLAGIAGAQRPLFLKIPYMGPKAMEELAGFDSKLVVGILGGSAGTTFDAFQQLSEARKYGARVALYGRMINQSEHQLSFIKHLRAIADGQLEPAEAVRSYHGALQGLGIKPYRSLDIDLGSTLREANYSGGSSKPRPGTVPARQNAAPARASNGSGTANAGTDTPDFASMTPAEKVKWNLKRWDRVLGQQSPNGSN
jgi:hypothetical protein